MYGLAVNEIVMQRRLGTVAQGKCCSIVRGAEVGEGRGRLLFSPGLCSQLCSWVCVHSGDGSGCGP